MLLLIQMSSKEVIHMIDIIITFLSIIGAFVYAGNIHSYMDKGVFARLIVFIISFLLLYIAAFIVAWLIFILISLTINTKKEYKKSSRFYGVVFSLIMENASYMAGARVTLKGMDKLPRNEKFLFVSNHQSNFDTFIQVGALRKYPIAFISKPENFKIPMGHRYMTRCRYMALDRENVRSGAIITKKAADMIASGDTSVGVYPEGTRNMTEDTLLEFKPGCFKSALWAKCPIVVSVVKGTRNIGKNFPLKRTKVTMEILEVLSYEQIKNMSTREISDTVRQIMLKGLEA